MRAAGPWIVLGAGAALVLVGALLAARELAFGRRARRVQGTVVGATLHMPRQGPSTLRPVVEFVVDGRARRFVGLLESRDWKDRQGETLEVLYDPASPQDAALADPVARFGAAAAWIFLGAVVAAAGLILRFRR
jgi:hypothetical protein